MVNVVADFQLDLGRACADILRSKGIPVPNGVEVDRNLDPCLQYFNWVWRRIPLRARGALRSRELAEKLASGALAADIGVALDRIEGECRAGADLNRYLSERIERPQLDDSLFNEWRVYHLHLDLPDGLAPRRPGFSRRTNQLLFVFVSGEDMLFLDVGRHGEWADKRFVEVIHTNWPDAIAPWRCDDVSDADVIDHDWARDAGASILTVLADKTVYVPIGGGYMMSGIAVAVVSERNRARTMARQLEDACRRHAQTLRDRIAGEMGRELDSLQFTLLVSEEAEHLVLTPCETQVGLAVRFGSRSTPIEHIEPAEMGR